MEEKENMGTMPEPKTINYDMVYKIISDKFISDLKESVGDIAYVKIEPYIKYVEAKKNKITIAELEEFIKKLEFLPYKYISKLMDSMKNKEVYDSYFVVIDNGEKK